MEYRAEGAQRFPTSYTLDALRRAMTAGDILESRALSFDSEKRLHFRLGEIEAIMPYEECADGVREGAVRDIALITRVGRPACFTVMEIDEQGAAPVALLSRTQAQQRCKAEYLDLLLPGDILPCRVTHLESFGSFCDIGCGGPGTSSHRLYVRVPYSKPGRPCARRPGYPVCRKKPGHRRAYCADDERAAGHLAGKRRRLCRR